MEKGSSIRKCFVCGEKVYFPKGKLKKGIFGFSHESCLESYWKEHIQRSAEHHVNLVRKSMIDALFSKHTKKFKEKKLIQLIKEENKRVK